MHLHSPGHAPPYRYFIDYVSPQSASYIHYIAEASLLYKLSQKYVMS